MLLPMKQLRNAGVIAALVLAACAPPPSGGLPDPGDWPADPSFPSGPAVVMPPQPPGPPQPLRTDASVRHSGPAQIKCPALAGAPNAVDPIAFHGQGSMGHVHQYFGNLVLLGLPDPSKATYAQIVAQKTTCTNNNDSASYWNPTLIEKGTGRVIEVKQFTAYYSSFDRQNQGPAEAFPPDTRLISPMTTDLKANNWTCGQFEEKRHPAQSSLPNCTGVSGKPGHTLTAHITFPSCWDGVLPNHPDNQTGDTRDNIHWSYTVKKGTTRTCPAAYPHQMAELRETIQFAYTGNAAANLTLSSDAMMNTTQGMSLHADFWNTWQQAGLEQMLDRCVRSNGMIFPGEC